MPSRTCILLLVMTAFPAIATPFGDGFTGSTASDYLETPDTEKVALVRMDGLKGVHGLQLKQAARAVFKDVPVQDSTKYSLAFRSRFTGGESAEENPRLARFSANTRVPPVLPKKEFQFFDAQQKKLKGFASGMPFREWQMNHDVFYPPAGAVTMRLVITSGHPDIRLDLDQFTFRETPDEGAINCSPVIGTYGRHNYSGWDRPANGGELIEYEGKTVYDVQYGTFGLSFPLEHPGTYRLSTKTRGNGYNSVMILHLLDAGGSKMEQVSLRKHGSFVDFVLPPGVVRGKFLTYSNLLEEVRLVRIGD